MATTQEDTLIGPTIEEPGETPYRHNIAGQPVHVDGTGRPLRVPAEAMPLALFMPNPANFEAIPSPTFAQQYLAPAWHDYVWPNIKHYGTKYAIPAALFWWGGPLVSATIVEPLFPIAYATVFPAPTSTIALWIYNFNSAAAYRAVQAWTISNGGAIFGGACAAITWGGPTAIHAIEATPSAVATIAKPVGGLITTLAKTTANAVSTTASYIAGATASAIDTLSSLGSTLKSTLSSKLSGFSSKAASNTSEMQLIIHPDFPISEDSQTAIPAVVTTPGVQIIVPATTLRAIEQLTATSSRQVIIHPTDAYAEPVNACTAKTSI